MRRFLVSSAAALGLVAAPAFAQEEGTTAQVEDARVADLMGSMFGEADPLTPEQESRLPAAQLVVDRIFPTGTYAKMMDESMKPMMDGIMGSMLQVPAAELAKLVGNLAAVDPAAEGSIGEAMAILDPAFEERNKRMMDTTLNMMTELMDEIEPSYRAGLTRAYAVRFTPAELGDMNAFFSTPSGSRYAAESMLIFMDPQVMSAMNELMPSMMEMMPKMMERMTQSVADLPPARTYSQLSADEQTRLARILGVSKDELAANEPAAETASEDAY
ncbi:DUF2059 domain-containing protein [Parerythrobacter jejuensis]|uniref:DUF2059 domain-containing protein n=1 Tax=Parerythrobacter jejuensis TaxID=795812 RepID=A0A845AMX4_9SPHN|nr:DUF2059 domain-containing protein [Parerythrobacter jejuensis]MXP30809.1 DUF2059 domain-containing protein [Parerythrobacter jejuensis]MXP33569.1 DUF2059 domain-containing protein [Parerythrobacter jejuensis]